MALIEMTLLRMLPPEIEKNNYLIKMVVGANYFEIEDEAVDDYSPEVVKVVLTAVEVTILDLVKKEVH